MTDEVRTTTIRTPDGLCPWCSKSVAGDPEHCPSCGASVRQQVEVVRVSDPVIPGLTEVDPALARRPAAAPRSRGVMAWLTGDTADDTSGARPDPSSLAPPDDEVRREMLRLKMDAIRRSLEADLAAAEALPEPASVPEPVDPGSEGTMEAGDGAA